jgi:hypothetical protein
MNADWVDEGILSYGFFPQVLWMSKGTQLSEAEAETLPQSRPKAAEQDARLFDHEFGLFISQVKRNPSPVCSMNERKSKRFGQGPKGEAAFVSPKDGNTFRRWQEQENTPSPVGATTWAGCHDVLTSHAIG